MSYQQDRHGSSEKLLKSVQWSALTIDEALSELSSNVQSGLTEEDVIGRRLQFGPNELAKEAPTALWKKVADQFRELLVWILIAAAVISGAIGDWIDALVVLAIVVANVAISLFHEERAGRALASLEELSSPKTKVTRNAKLMSLPARELVPGDHIELEAGDYVPADARLVNASSLRVQESVLTGEARRSTRRRIAWCQTMLHWPNAAT